MRNKKQKVKSKTSTNSVTKLKLICIFVPLQTILFLVFSFSFLVASAQFDFTKEENTRANLEIQKLKNSVIVVRLKTKQRQIEAYRSTGQTALANKIEEKALIENLRIISACIKFFNFAKIYFVNTEDMEFFRQTDRLILSNLLPQKDSVVTLSHDSVYYLDYGYLYGRQRVNEWTYKDYDNTIENSQIISEHAFVIRNNKSEQLAAPLPFYTVTMGGGKKLDETANILEPYLQLNPINSNSLIEEDLRKVNFIDKYVMLLNNNLIRYYNKATQQELVNIKDWYKNNPNTDLYPQWIDIAKKLQSLQNANPQFIGQ